MDDVRTVAEELHRLAESEPQEPFDTAQLLARGRRGRRRRRVFAAGGAVACVAAVALTASLLPELTSADDQPGVAGDQQAALFEAVPGVPRGEEAIGQKLTMAEAQRRCALRFPDEKRSLARPHEGPRVGQRLMYTIKIGSVRRQCSVPGGDKPTAAMLAEVAKDPVPSTTAGQLRNCSAQTWVDVTGWKVMSSARLSTTGASVVVAVSPSGKSAIACEIDRSTPTGGMISQGTTLMTLDQLYYDNNVYTPATATQRAQLWTGVNIGGNKDGYVTVGWGRLNGDPSRIRLQLDAKTRTDVPVTDGWFAYYWQTPPTKAKIADFHITAYDKAGKVVKVLR